MRFLTTIFVIAMTVTACTGSQDDSQINNDSTRRAVGVESKTGKSLIATELCSEIKTEAATGKNTVETIQFQRTSSFTRRTLSINDQVQFVVEKTSRGYWGYLNNTLLLTEGGVKTNYDVKEIAAGTDTCFQLTSAEKSTTFCPCH